MAHIYGSLIACLWAALVPGLAAAIAFADPLTGVQIGGVSAILMFLAARPKHWRLPQPSSSRAPKPSPILTMR